MLFTRLMGMISLGFGLMLFAAFLRSPSDILASFFGFVKYCFPPIFVGIDLMIRKFPAVQTAVLHEVLDEKELECRINVETLPGDPPC